MSPLTLRRALLASVFLTGACVLIIEVVATRILAPYFGNTIYNFSSVIGVILAALSLGYYLGGRLADKQASLRQFFQIILAAAISVLILAGLVIYVLPSLTHFFSLISGPPVVSVLFFFLPALLLGLLSPYVVTLLHQILPAAGIGTTSGSVFFWGTLGSLAGTFLAGFYLVPAFGVRQIIIGVGLALLALGLTGLSMLPASPPGGPASPAEAQGTPGEGGASARRLQKLPLTAITLALLLISSFYFYPSTLAGVVHQSAGFYQTITIRDGLYHGRPARHLLQDLNLSGSIFIDDNTVASSYAQYYVLHELLRPEINRALVIGGGAYLVPRELLHTQPNIEVITAEIEPGLDLLAQKYFGLPASPAEAQGTPGEGGTSPRHQNIITDGRRYLHDTQQPFDLIFSDAYHSFYSIPAHLTSVEFFTLVKDKLSPGGVFIANIAGSLAPAEHSFTLSELKTLNTVFDNSYLFALESPASLEPQNLIYVAVNGDQRLDLGSPLVTRHPDPIISTLPAKAVSLSDLPLAQHPVLTDNYAPVDFLSAQLAKQVSRSFKGG